MTRYWFTKVQPPTLHSRSLPVSLHSGNQADKVRQVGHPSAAIHAADLLTRWGMLRLPHPGCHPGCCSAAGGDTPDDPRPPHRWAPAPT